MTKLLPDGPIDTLGVLDAVLAMPDHLDVASDLGPVADLPPATAIDHVVVAGADRTAAEIVRALAAPVSPIPVLVHHEHPLPAHVSVRSLCVIASYDGDDADAVQTAASARGAGARLVVVSGPGQLHDLAAQWGAPHVPVVADVPVPRAAVAAVVVPVLSILEQLGVFAELAESVAAAVTQLRVRRTELTAADSPAARLARRVGRTLPIIYGSDDLGAVAAQRWKAQVNQNAKVAAFANAVPELTRDEIAGWGQHGDVTRQVFSLLTLRHGHEHAMTDVRFDVVDELVEEVVAERYEIHAEGDGRLAQLFDLVFQGDLFSYHLAQQNEIDPGPVAAVEAVAERIRRSGPTSRGAR